jgi:hypothetical protein
MEPETLIGRCPEGQEFVRGYRKRSGEYVKGFCRKRHERITRHDREVDLRNIRKAQQFMEDDEPESKQEIKEELKEEHNEGSIEPTIRAAEEKREQ